LTNPAPRRRYKRIRTPGQLTAEAGTAAASPSAGKAETQPQGTTLEEAFDPKTAVSVGRISSVHGVHGELKVQALTDFPQRFEAGARLWLDGVSVRVERSRWQGRNVVLKLEGVDTRTEGEALRGKELQVASAQALDEGTFYQHDIIGLRVETPAGERLGRVADVLSTGSADVYVVRGERGELLLPAVEDVVREIDVAGGRMLVELLEGLEFTKRPGPKPRRPTGEERRLSGEGGASV
jgi:16S rRNA processing protein RimM